MAPILAASNSCYFVLMSLKQVNIIVTCPTASHMEVALSIESAAEKDPICKKGYYLIKTDALFVCKHLHNLYTRYYYFGMFN